MTQESPDPAKPPRGNRVWIRFIAAAVVIVASMAAATSISALAFLAEIAKRGGGINVAVAPAGSGDPQNILILGSDARPGDQTSRSDTTILVRVDPQRGTISLLSIPRDLRVSIPKPGHGPDKFNAAYAYGGPKLTVKVVQRLTGLRINHVVNVDFNGFADAVDALGCVYLDVDRHYFNDNSLAASVAEQYSEIDIEAGYQRLCGFKALEYVRYRHEDTDLVRSARQQDFVREARQKLDLAKFVFDSEYRDGLIKIFNDYTSTDNTLRDANELLELIKAFASARNATINEVHFPAQIGGPTDPYVTASDDAIKQTIAQFKGTGTPGPSPTGVANQPANKPGSGGQKPKPPHKPEPKPNPQPGDATGLVDASASGQQYAQLLAGSKRGDGKPMIDFPVLYPTQLLASSSLDEASRAFPIDGPGQDVFHGYKFVAGFGGAGGFTEYYGVSGTDWPNPPILDNPSETRTIDGRGYLLFFDGDRVRLVGYKSGQGSYWVINTLTQTLDEDQMLAIATSLKRLDK